MLKSLPSVLIKRRVSPPTVKMSTWIAVRTKFRGVGSWKLPSIHLKMEQLAVLEQAMRYKMEVWRKTDTALTSSISSMWWSEKEPSVWMNT